MRSVQAFIENNGRLIALVFLAGAIYARSEFMLASAVKEIDKLAAAMEELRKETVSLKVELSGLRASIGHMIHGEHEREGQKRR